MDLHPPKFCGFRSRDTAKELAKLHIKKHLLFHFQIQRHPERLQSSRSPHSHSLTLPLQTNSSSSQLNRTQAQRHERMRGIATSSVGTESPQFDARLAHERLRAAPLVRFLEPNAPSTLRFGRHSVHRHRAMQPAWQ